MKSYVRNTINLSCAKILLTSVIIEKMPSTFVIFVIQQKASCLGSFVTKKNIYSCVYGISIIISIYISTMGCLLLTTLDLNAPKFFFTHFTPTLCLLQLSNDPNFSRVLCSVDRATLYTQVIS